MSLKDRKLAVIRFALDQPTRQEYLNKWRELRPLFNEAFDAYYVNCIGEYDKSLPRKDRAHLRLTVMTNHTRMSDVVSVFEDNSEMLLTSPEALLDTYIVGNYGTLDKEERFRRWLNDTRIWIEGYLDDLETLEQAAIRTLYKKDRQNTSEWPGASRRILWGLGNAVEGRTDWVHMIFCALGINELPYAARKLVKANPITDFEQLFSCLDENLSL